MFHYDRQCVFDYVANQLFDCCLSWRMPKCSKSFGEVFWTFFFFFKLFSNVSYITRLLVLALNELCCSTPFTKLLLLLYLVMRRITTQRELELGALTSGVQDSMIIIGWKVGERRHKMWLERSLIQEDEFELRDQWLKTTTYSSISTNELWASWLLE